MVSRRTGGSEGLGFGGRSDRLQALLDEPETGLRGVGGTWVRVAGILVLWQGLVFGRLAFVDEGAWLSVPVVVADLLRWFPSPRR